MQPSIHKSKLALIIINWVLQFCVGFSRFQAFESEGGRLQLDEKFNLKIQDLYYLSNLCIPEYEWVENDDMNATLPDEKKTLETN